MKFILIDNPNSEDCEEIRVGYILRHHDESTGSPDRLLVEVVESNGEDIVHGLSGDQIDRIKDVLWDRIQDPV